MKGENLKDRTKKFGLDVLGLVDKLPNTITGRAIGNQLVRSGTSVGANYRAACRARSRAEFVARIGVVIEEADETAFWLEMISEREIVSSSLLQQLLGEANELVAIMTTSRKTAESGKNRHSAFEIRN
ncbi:MAG: four helix bundle protein [Kiritimatiellae bacterium]|nr:four helix bundle protein [Kiritimatiellia bacterium]MDD5520435.1 four helix bundle protein [Kiritimatiellia bacterium]